MRRLLVPAVLALAAAAIAAVPLLRTAGAQDAQATLWVTGIRIDGTKARAVVRLTNTSRDGHDLFAVHYTIQAANAGEPLSQLAAGPTGTILGRGRTVELDVGDIVTRWRTSLGMDSFAGPVRLVAFADSSGAAFGPDVVQVTATQTEGRATYEPMIEWR